MSDTNKAELLKQLEQFKQGALDFREQAKLEREIADASSELHAELVQMLEKETEPAAQIELLRLMGITQDAFYADAILIFLRSAHAPEVRQTAATSLGLVRSPKSFAALIDLLDDASPNVRLGAVYGLQAFGDRGAIKHLLTKLSDQEPVPVWWNSPKAGGYTVAKEATVAIDDLSDQAFKGNIQKIKEWIERQEYA